MEVTLTGYQWGDFGEFIGTYQFPANQDKYDIHMPPNTTLVAPPSDIPVDREAAWDGSGEWILRKVRMGWMPDRSPADYVDPAPVVVSEVIEDVSNGA